GYPWRWSVVPWFEGTPAVALPPARRDPWAPELARALAALHVAAPAAAPPNPFRGVPLLERDPVVQQRVAAMPDAQVLLEAWQDGLAAPAFDGAPRWLHGDLHPANLLSRDGGLA
ncbi:MAG TPA: phosphotransferase, partial [Actinotalea sp.]|nr:phosphotransferase [Actinotalea sp.]